MRRSTRSRCSSIPKSDISKTSKLWNVRKFHFCFWTSGARGLSRPNRFGFVVFAGSPMADIFTAEHYLDGRMVSVPSFLCREESRIPFLLPEIKGAVCWPMFSQICSKFLINLDNSIFWNIFSECLCEKMQIDSHRLSTEFGDPIAQTKSSLKSARRDL